MYKSSFFLTFLAATFFTGSVCSEDFKGVGDQIGVTQGRVVNPTFESELPGNSSVESSQSEREKILARGLSQATTSITKNDIAKAVKSVGDKGLKSKLQAIVKTTRTINVDSGENRILTVSKGQLNRIITPFSNPVIMDSSKENESTLFAVDNVIFFGSNSNRPIGIYVSPDGDPSVALSLTLSNDPQVGPQEYTIELNDYVEINDDVEAPSEVALDKANEFERVAVTQYIDWIKAFGLDLALGNIPPGYSMATPNSSMYCSMKNIEIKPMQIIKGADYYVEVFKASNNTTTSQVILDQSCHSKNVKFVMPWPTHLLEPGDAVELFVVKQEARPDFNKRQRFLN
jgi:hypothetical protein